MRDRPKTKSQRKMFAAGVQARVDHATNAAVGQSADRLGTPSVGTGQALTGKTIV